MLLQTLAILRRSAMRYPGIGATAIGLASIPFIIHPIDHGTDLFMDNVMRPNYSQYMDRSEKSVH